MTLAVCATPIGNLDDVTLRVLAELAEADVVLCEHVQRCRQAARRLERDDCSRPRPKLCAE